MISAEEALEKLKSGNRRYVSGAGKRNSALDHEKRAELVNAQSPFAIILGCSDSRVPAELVFDQSIGDLFVIRVAGNVVARSQIGSIEFAAGQYGTPLVVVMGHSHCGAVTAALDQLEQSSEVDSPNLGFIVNRISPTVQALLDQGLGEDRDELIGLAVRENVRASVKKLRHGSDVLEALLQENRLRIVAAEYSLETGVVDFFDATA